MLRATMFTNDSTNNKSLVKSLNTHASLVMDVLTFSLLTFSGVLTFSFRIYDKI